MRDPLRRYIECEVVESSLEPDFTACVLKRENRFFTALRCFKIERTVFQQSFPLELFGRRLRFELQRIRPLYSVVDGCARLFSEHEAVNFV